MGKSLILDPPHPLAPLDGFKIWSATYDHAPNPLLALEQRLALPLLGSLQNLRVADLCAGTGRWSSLAREQGARVVAIDLCPEMIRIAARRHNAVLADLQHLPLAAGSFDLAICSFAVSYVPSLSTVFEEFARLAPRILVSDLHPAAQAAGWTRSFPIRTFARSLADLDAAARAAGLQPESSIEARFGEPERPIFDRAGKSRQFGQLRRIPAIFLKTWTRPC